MEYIPNNILITGGAGFIGSNMVIHLIKKYPQYKIVNLDNLEYCSSLNNLKEIERYRSYKFVKGDIKSSDLINYILAKDNIDTIIHFAAQSHVDNSFGNSIKFTETNILGTHVLLESAKQANIKRFIHISTDEVYGEIDEHNSAEEEKILEPTNPYAATKAGAEFIVKSYFHSFKLPIIITRGNNVYGPRQFPEKIIPKFILRLNENLPCCIHGDGSNIRNYIYVDDVVNAIDIILHKGQIGQIYNIGSDMELSNLEVAKRLTSAFNKDIDKYIEFVDDRKYNDKRYSIMSDKLHAIGWSCSTPWNVGIAQTIKWYLENKNNWNINISELIKQYM